MPDDAVLDFKLNDLREPAIMRAAALAQQLQADHADLLQCQDRGKTSDIEIGIERVGKAMALARQLRSELRGG